MIRFDGNTILLAEGDRAYADHLSSLLTKRGAKCFLARDILESKELLNKYDFDLIIANYHLGDGIIHQLIDWCSKNLKFQPIFTCIGYPLATDIYLFQKQSIAEIYTKTDSERIMSSLSKLLFNFHEFHESLLQMVAPHEIQIEVTVSEHSFLVTAVEINDESIFLATSEKFPKGTFGILKFSLTFDDQFQNFIIPGFFDGRFTEGMIFTINKKYVSSWGRFLKYLSMKQVNISEFLSKAAGY